MHQREQEKCARDRSTAVVLADIADQIAASQHLVDAAFLAPDPAAPVLPATLSSLGDTHA